ncbi:lysine--tRNA ligase [Tanacetum coccineum]|uniref:Lysine--tRNA ligase n=1 Tax=Tanacetum coccineum TaxID=301880 RepID=A0ABQ5E8W3_9ASTR
MRTRGHKGRDGGVGPQTQDGSVVALSSGCIWLFEQEQAFRFSIVSINVRMTLIKLKSGGLWVHAPIAPIKEYIQFSELLGHEDTRSDYIKEFFYKA